MAGNRVLFVDDEPDLLEGIQRMLFRERQRWEMHFAPGAVAGLAELAKVSFAVVVADMRMPQMDGIEFLKRVHRAAPDTVRMMLTGNTDQETAIKAVNDGNVFRFMTKPVERETLVKVIEAGMEQHRLITAEKELLSGTLVGSVHLLTELLSETDPDSFTHALWLRDMARAAVQELRIASSWEIILAATLSRISYLTLPTGLANKARARRELSPPEQEVVAALPEVGSRLISKIPRLEGVSKIILYLRKNYDGTGFPDDQVAGQEIPLGARVLRIFDDLAHLSGSESSRYRLLNLMQERRGWYDPDLVDSLFPLFVPPHSSSSAADEGVVEVMANELHLGDRVLGNVTSEDGQLLLALGNRISPASLEKIRVCAALTGIKEPILIEKRFAKDPDAA